MAEEIEIDSVERAAKFLGDLVDYHTRLSKQAVETARAHGEAGAADVDIAYKYANRTAETARKAIDLLVRAADKPEPPAPNPVPPKLREVAEKVSLGAGRQLRGGHNTESDAAQALILLETLADAISEGK